MENAIRTKDKNYKHVFKGTTLVNSLIEAEKFKTREEAVIFGQKLLDIKTIRSVVDSKTFDDSSQLFQWVDKTLVKSAINDITHKFHKSSGKIPMNQLPGASTDSSIAKRKENLERKSRRDRRKTVDSVQNDHRQFEELTEKHNVEDIKKKLSLNKSAEDLRVESSAEGDEQTINNVNGNQEVTNGITNEEVEDELATVKTSQADDTKEEELKTHSADDTKEEEPEENSTDDKIIEESEIKNEENELNEAHKDQDEINTCTYDGQEMSALNLEEYSTTKEKSRYEKWEQFIKLNI